MAYEYDRFEREEGGGSFLMGLLAGTVLGAGLGMLFAPKAGSELRSQLGSQIADQGREAYDRARNSVNSMSAAGTSGSTASGGTGNLGSTSTQGGTYGA